VKTKNYFIIAFISLFFITSCKKDSPVAAVTYPIEGLWVGSYTNTSGTFFFSFSIYTDGTLSYKSKATNNATYFADGSWSLTDTTFTFNVFTINAPGNQFRQTGTGIYSKSKGTLTTGTGSDQPSTTPFTWTMTRVN
jgi:hypothetical protein